MIVDYFGERGYVTATVSLNESKNIFNGGKNLSSEVT